MPIGELNRPISEIAPHIFRRPVLSVSPSDSLLQVGTFLAIGPQIYVDGLVVLDGAQAVGRIGGSHIIQHILQHEHDWFQSTAFSIMSNASYVVNAGDSLSVALDIFWKTRFAFVPVAIGSKVATTLSLRDILPVVGVKHVLKAGELASRLISVDPLTTMRTALELMLERGIRNLAVVDGQEAIRFVNDRKILEYLLSHEGRQAIAEPKGLDMIRVGQLDLVSPKYLKKDAPARVAAEYLTDIGTPCLLLEDSRIVTPWDIVMKGIRG